MKWNDLLSDKCKIRNGVKQGGCLSPSLFSIYLNHSILNLRLAILVVNIDLNIWECMGMLMT